MKRISLLAFMLLPFAASAQSVPDKYFGYFGGDYPPAPNTDVGSGFAEMKAHINLYSLQNWSGFTTPDARAENQNRVLTRLAEAKAAHVHAIVPAHPFVFQAVRDSATGNITCWNNDPTAAASWASLSQAMVDQGYLIPGDPVRSTVVAVYIVDEPNSIENVCLSDTNGQANPSFVNAVNAVRQDPRTASLPIASILSRNADNFSQGAKLLDWVGFDYYPYNNDQWKSAFASFKAAVPGKKYIVVPGAQENCPGVTNNDPTAFVNAMNTDPSVVWLAPFMWGGGTPPCKGVRDLPDRRTTYTQEGLNIRNAQCARSQADKLFCSGTVDISAALNLLLN
ncbi:hypothetical protein EC912_101550 [Luteibacter rhizovicinus]|uniref:Uncharacterized protein n=1 Tax=Luteibacter rhizovicinus TaxID=242606 RepID=A0A4R3Z122_9GAMM|nr:hypothetical protein [Luteibacter rhizovicinus]TCV97534.1 hypothetical protein EC912_101550 [Luteibacter rhizovicinus]